MCSFQRWKEPMAQATFSCPFGAIHLETRWGSPSMNTWLAPVFIGVTPLDPHFTGAGHFGFLVNPGGQNQDLFPSYSQATGPFCQQIL